MNESGKQLPNGPDSHPAQHKICDACKKKDDEDVYIVFNVLYRVIIGDIFYQRLTKDDLNLDVELLQEERSKQMTEEAKSGEEKLHLFQQEVSSEILIEIMTSSHFDQLLQEIFKSKYSRINETTCNHQDFARHFIECFNISHHSVKKERTSLKLDRLDALLISIRKLKEDIQKYNAEISRLPNHIMTRLFESHASSSKKNLNRVDDVENNSGSSGNGKEDDSRQATSSNNTSGNVQSSSCNGTYGSNGRSELSTNYESNGNNDSSGSNQNNGSGEGGSSDQSTESNNVNDGTESNRKRSKALPFKSKLPKKATDILKNWFLGNINNPYPSHEAKENLSKLTGLTRKQIQNWFTNSRKRFLEPLKKKMEGKKSTGLTPSDMPTIEPVVDVAPAQIVNNAAILSQPMPEIPIQPNPQLKPVTQFISPIAATIAPMNNNPAIIKQMMPQRIQLPIQQPQIQNQAFLYQPNVMPQGVLPQGVLPQGMLQQGPAMQHGNNILIVPYIVPQNAPVTYYRQPEFVAVNPSFIQFPQGNVGGMGNIGPGTPNMNVANMGNMGNVQQLEQQSPINQNQMVQYPYFVPMQQHGMVEMRPGTHPNLSNNYNTINNNIYNNINGLNGIGSGLGNGGNGNVGQMIPITLANPNMTPLMNMGNFGGIPQQVNIAGMSHMDPNLMRTAAERPGSVSKSNQGDFSGNIFDGSMASPRTLQRNIGGIYHPRPELDEMNLQGRKHLHKDHNPENDTN